MKRGLAFCVGFALAMHGCRREEVPAPIREDGRKWPEAFDSWAVLPPSLFDSRQHLYADMKSFYDTYCRTTPLARRVLIAQDSEWLRRGVPNFGAYPTVSDAEWENIRFAQLSCLQGNGTMRVRVREEIWLQQLGGTQEGDQLIDGPTSFRLTDWDQGFGPGRSIWLRLQGPVDRLDSLKRVSERLFAALRSNAMAVSVSLDGDGRHIGRLPGSLFAPVVERLPEDPSRRAKESYCFARSDGVFECRPGRLTGTAP